MPCSKQAILQHPKAYKLPESQHLNAYPVLKSNFPFIVDYISPNKKLKTRPFAYCKLFSCFCLFPCLNYCTWYLCRHACPLSGHLTCYISYSSQITYLSGSSLQVCQFINFFFWKIIILGLERQMAKCLRVLGTVVEIEVSLSASTLDRHTDSNSSSTRQGALF